MEEDRKDLMVFTDRLSYWQFIQNVEYDIRVTKDKEIFNKNELIAVFRPHSSTDAEISV
ncbi:MAG TPA: hypothetical protein PLN36_05205 [Bacteroidales bacterium]|nr:hypothetical protein [Bacteroidales bacterium]